ncbi:MAG TPA: hypothetical protein VFY96_14530 [Candidatus Binatia bacterium]|nr:hypothetical protein [Candidatus Binatia bacterium]
MSFDAKTILANLVEQERIKGHHSPEGRAIRTLARALSGWSAGTLSAADVIILCEQSVEDWLKARLKRSPWSVESLPALLSAAVGQNLITPSEESPLQKIHQQRELAVQAGAISIEAVQAALEFCIQLIEKHW